MTKDERKIDECRRAITESRTSPTSTAIPTGVELIKKERERQIVHEGWTPEHDDNHRSGELNDAAIGYAQAAAYQARGESHAMISSAQKAGMIRWPWEDSWWKPSEDQIRNLVKAGALIAAEIDRIQRSRQ